MIAVRLRWALALAVSVAVFSGAARSQDVPLSTADLQAKLTYCKTCHGLSGQGYHGFFPIPRLAGQQTEYIENQLAAFIERRRENKYMYDVAHVLSPATRTALAKHFTGLNAKPLGGAPRKLVAMGKKIYEDGIP